MRLSIKTQMMILIVIMVIVTSGIILWATLHQRNDELQHEVLFAERLSNEVSNDQKILLASAEQLLSSFAYIPCILNRDAKAVQILFAELIKKNTRCDQYPYGRHNRSGLGFGAPDERLCNG